MAGTTNASNSITLFDYGLMSNSPLIRKIIVSWLEYNSILTDIPLVTYPSLTMNGSRFLAAAINSQAVNYRKINEQPVLWKAVPKPYAESAFILSGQFAIDTVLLKDINRIGSPFALQLEAWNKAVVRSTNDIIVNGNQLNDIDQPVGWRNRIANASTWDIPSEMLIKDSSVDISGGSAANGLAVLESIQTGFDNMGKPDGDGVMMYADERLWRKLDRCVRAAGTSGGFNVSQDQYGRSVVKYKNATKRVTGRKADDVTHIIGAETTAGVADTLGTATASSMFLVNMDAETGFGGWQMQSMDESLMGPILLPSMTQQQMTVDYPWGFFQQGVRSIAQIYGIAIGAAPAAGG